MTESWVTEKKTTVLAEDATWHETRLTIYDNIPNCIRKLASVVCTKKGSIQAKLTRYNCNISIRLTALFTIWAAIFAGKDLSLWFECETFISLISLLQCTLAPALQHGISRSSLCVFMILLAIIFHLKEISRSWVLNTYEAILKTLKFFTRLVISPWNIDLLVGQTNRITQYQLRNCLNLV